MRPACRLLVAALLALALGGCPFGDPGEDPVRSAQAFLRAVKSGRCDQAWTWFSAETQVYIEHFSATHIEAEPYYADSFAPKRIFCRPTFAHRFHRYSPGSARWLAGDAEEAWVGFDLMEPTGFLLPGFFSTRQRAVPVEMRMVHDRGGWRVHLAPPGWRPPEASPQAPARARPVERRPSGGQEP